jgi:protein involved in polysaccharide export with SLBB domain
MIKLKWFLFFIFILLVPNVLYAQTVQIIPVTPQPQGSTQLQPLPMQQPQPAQPAPFQQPPTPLRPSVEKPSEFEHYVSEKTEITDTQFEILKRYRGITFSYISQPPPGNIVIPVRIIKKPEKAEAFTAAPIEVDVGFLIGTSEALGEAFRMLGIKSPLTVSTDIRQFGYDLFKQPPSTFAPVDKVPVGPEYVIAPGDEIRVTVWGKIDGQWSLVVDRDGNITIPRIGVLGVTGLTFKELKELLHRELSKYYTGFEMNVSMGALRTIRVYVVGYAQRPGAYTVSSLSTLVNALFEAGGPSKTGTMRRIEVKRNGEKIVEFDVYDLLIKGDKTKDIRLMPEDVIFIPPAGPLAGIAGSVKNPAIYELKGETTLSHLIDMAGGLSDIAFANRVQIDRIVDNTRQIVFEAELDKVKDMKIQGGDIGKVFPIVEDKRIVRITGAVQRPGDYGFSSGMTVKDLIEMAGGLKYYAYFREAEIIRVHLTPEGPKTEKIIIDIEKAFAGPSDPQYNIPLQQDDYLFVRAIPEWELYRMVTITGEVRFPGVYPIKKGERVSSLFERAGGLTDKAYMKGAIFKRVSVKELQQKNIDEMIDRLERELMGVGTAQVATATTSEEAKIFQMELEQKRQFISRLKTIKAQGRMVIRLDIPERFKGTTYDIELEDGDSLHIPQNPGTLQVLGSVYNQTAFVYDKYKSLSDYINLAGGYTRGADRSNAYILKVDGSAVKPDKGVLGIVWHKATSRWVLEESGELEPGDTIVVPERLERIAWMRNIKDITQILYQVAVTAGVLITVF